MLGFEHKTMLISDQRATTTPNCLMRVKGVKVCVQHIITIICQLTVGSEFNQFGKMSIEFLVLCRKLLIEMS